MDAITPSPPPDPAGPSLSLFSGAMGLDLGLEAAGFSTKAAVEVNKWAVKTIRDNTEVPVIDRGIQDVPTAELLAKAGLSCGEPTVVTAGPSCQSFSTAGHRRSLGSDDGWLFSHFLRVVREAQPRFFVMEQVRGVLSAAVRHRPLAQRGPGCPPLDANEQHGSAFRLILDELRALDYYVVFGLVDAAGLGAAQHRQRLVFVGSRDGEDVRIPGHTHGPELIPYRTLRNALTGLHDPEPAVNPMPPGWAHHFEKVPQGGNWRDLPAEDRKAALGKAYDSWGGRVGFFRRLHWDRPTPALTTNPAAKATMLLHPDARPPRVLSVAEYARVQGFPDDWAFAGTARAQYVQIGNAVPRAIGEAVGRGLADLARRPAEADPSRKGVVACADAGLIARMNRRPRTVLNPARMRKSAERADAVRWLSHLGGGTRPPVDVVVLDAA